MCPPRSRSTMRTCSGSRSRTSTCSARCVRWRTTSAMLAFQAAGAVVFDYGNNLRAQAQDAGVENAFDYPGFVPALIRPQFCEGRGPFRWVALSGDPADILRPTGRRWSCFPRIRACCAGWRWPGRRSRSRACRPGSAGWATESGRRPAWRSTGSSPRRGRCADRHRARSPGLRVRRQSEPRDRGDARRHGRRRGLAPPQRARQHRGRRDLGVVPPRGRTGIGYSQHAGRWSWPTVPSRRPPAGAGADQRPGLGVARHVDAGYERAIEVARERGIRIPMLDG